MGPNVTRPRPEPGEGGARNVGIETRKGLGDVKVVSGLLRDPLEKFIEVSKYTSFSRSEDRSFSVCPGPEVFYGVSGTVSRTEGLRGGRDVQVLCVVKCPLQSQTFRSGSEGLTYQEGGVGERVWYPQRPGYETTSVVRTGGPIPES